MRRLAEIDNFLIRKVLSDGIGYGQSANPGVEYADGIFVRLLHCNQPYDTTEANFQMTKGPPLKGNIRNNQNILIDSVFSQYSNKYSETF